MAELKTKPSARSVDRFLGGVQDAAKRENCFTLLDLMRKITRSEPRMWGTSIVGFGSYRYRYESGREGEWFLTGFSPRKRDITLYLGVDLDARADLLRTLGKHSRGKGCLHIRSLEDVSLPVLRRLIERSIEELPRASK